MRTKLLKSIFTCVVTGLLLAVTSCNSYDDEISDLQAQVDALRSTVEAINSAIDGGAVIDKVESTNDGIIITLSDNSTYTINNGANGSVITVGENGNWFIDGTDTDKPVSGEDGTDGNDGAITTPTKTASGTRWKTGWKRKLNSHGSRKEP